MMKRFDQLARWLQIFFITIQTKFRSYIKRIRIDNAFSEVKASSMNALVCTPHQNGVVERKHKHILIVAEALRFQAKILANF